MNAPQLPTPSQSPQASKDQQRADYVTRDSILKLLSPSELAAVSTAEAAPRIIAGAEYLDLEHLEKGIQQASAAAIPPGPVLVRMAVLSTTWTAILATLAGFPPEVQDATAILPSHGDEITLPPSSVKAVSMTNGA
jgi:hypothetical protein